MKKILSLLLLLSILIPQTSIADTTAQTLFFDETLSVEKDNLKTLFGTGSQERYDARIQKYLEEKTESHSLIELSTRLSARLATLEFDESVPPETKQKMRGLGEYVRIIIKQKQLEESGGSSGWTQSPNAADTLMVQKELLHIEEMMSAPLKNHFQTSVLPLLGGKKQTGNLSIDISVKDEALGMYESIIKFSGLEGKDTGFDSQLQGKFELLIKSLLTDGSGSTDFELSTWFDMIQKDGETYMRYDDLIATNTEHPIIGIYLELLKKIAQKDMYVRMPSTSSASLIIGKSIFENIRSLSEETQNSEALYTPFAQSGSLYSLVPTQRWCGIVDTLSDIENTFSHFSCDGAVLEESFLQEGGQATLDLSNPKQKKFHYTKVTSDVLVTMSIIYSDSKILSAYIDVIPNQNTFKGEGIGLHFEDGKYFSLKSVMGGVGTIDISGVLSAKNTFTSLEASVQIDDTFSLITSLKDKIISGGFAIKKVMFAGMEEGETTRDIFRGNIEGNMDNLDNLEALSLSGQGEDLFVVGDGGAMYMDMFTTHYDMGVSYGMGAYYGSFDISSDFTGAPMDRSQVFTGALIVEKNDAVMVDVSISGDTHVVMDESVVIEAPTEFVDIEDIDVGSQVEIME